MRRFLAFPLILGVVGTLFPLLGFEGLASVAPVILRSGGSPFSPPPDVIESLRQIALGLAVFGAFLGLVAATFDLIMNRRKPRKAGQLAGNIAWCFLYAQAVIAVDALLVFSSVWFYADKLWQSSFKLPIVFLSCSLPILLGFVAAGWGTVRTLSRNDVLSPRVLKAKLKRSSHIEG